MCIRTHYTYIHTHARTHTHTHQLSTDIYNWDLEGRFFIWCMYIQDRCIRSHTSYEDVYILGWWTRWSVYTRLTYEMMCIYTRLMYQIIHIIWGCVYARYVSDDVYIYEIDVWGDLYIYEINVSDDTHHMRMCIY